MITAILMASLINQPSEGIRTRANGLETIEFSVPEGKITVLLPDDLCAGDIISGTVSTEPIGSGQQKQKNSDVLEGMVISLGDSNSTTDKDHEKWILLETLSTTVEVALRDKSGKQISTATIPLNYGAEGPSTSPFAVDPIIQSGKPIQICGPFDGNAGNSKVSLGSGSPTAVIAESPRSCVVATTPQQNGPLNVTVNENGTTTEHKTHVLSIQLSAPKTDLLRGESTDLRVRVTGFEGLGEDAYPIPIELTNLTPSIIQLEGATGNCISQGITQSQVQNGQFNFNTKVVAKMNGAFQIKGVLFRVSLHDAKKLMSMRQFRDWVGGLIAIYEAKIAELKKELTNDPNNRGLQLNIQRREANLQTLKTFRSPTGQMFDSAKTAVDRALAVDNFFSVAADLITIAADMLGYSGLPIPGVGAVLKGAKAFASKFPDVIKAIEKAEKLVEEYNKISDAQAKIDKAKEIKDALDKVKEALDKADQ